MFASHPDFPWYEVQFVADIKVKHDCLRLHEANRYRLATATPGAFLIRDDLSAFARQRPINFKVGHLPIGVSSLPIEFRMEKLGRLNEIHEYSC